MWQVSVLILLLCYSEAQRRPPLRIYAGEEDILGEFPFTVSLETTTRQRFCTGSLIARNWVLTAGHCIVYSRFKIRYSNFTMRSSRASFANVLKAIRHPAYRQSKRILFNDVALVQTSPVKDKVIGRLSGLDYKCLIGLPVKYAGFGWTAHNSKEQFAGDKYRPLQTGEAVVTFMRSHLRGPRISIAPQCSRMMQGIRSGDSGGPLIYDGRIIGVAMSSNSRTNIAHYTALSPSLQWINHTMNVNGVIR